MIKRAVQDLIYETIEVIKRFPLAVLFCPIFCVLSIISVADKDVLLGKYLASAFCGFFLFITVGLLSESRKLKRSHCNAVGIAIFLAILYKFYTAEDIEYPLALLGTGLFLSVFVAAFLNNKSSSMQLWTFSYQLWTRIFFIILIAIIASISFVIMNGAIDLLFGICCDELFEYIWLVVSTLILPILAMTGIPRSYDNIIEINYPKVIRVILSYIMVPSLLIYAALLYVYALGIIIIWSLPEGGIVYMVLSFGCIGMLTYLISYPLHDISSVIKLFNRYFFKILILPLIMMAVSIAVRINEYGVTEGRYVVLLGIFWFMISIYFALTKYKKELPRLILLSLVILCLGSSFGPWGMVGVSSKSQIGRLKELFERNHLFVNDKLQISNKEISLVDRIAISSTVYYIIDTKKNKMIKAWFSDLIPSAEFDTLNSKEIVQKIGIEYVAQSKIHKKEEASYNFYNTDTNEPYVDISSYSYLIKSDFYHRSDNTNNIKDITIDDPKAKLLIRIESTSNGYEVQINKDEKVTFAFEDLIKLVETDYTKDVKLLSQVKEISNMSIKLVLNQASGQFKKGNNKPNINHSNIYILIKCNK